MRTLIIILACILFQAVQAQSNVGIGTTNPDASAKLEVQSTTKGMLIPRMTQAQRNAIVSPATGLMVYQTDQAAGTWYYDGAQWQGLSDNLGNHTAEQILDMDTNRVINVQAPILGLDAVNKDYVDAAVAGGGGSGGTIGCNMPTEISKVATAISHVGEAFTYCDTLTEGGNADWVVPTLDQLSYALGGGCVIPDLRTSNFLWTRTPDQYYSNWWFAMRADNARIDANSGNNTSYRVRCVR